MIPFIEATQSFVMGGGLPAPPARYWRIQFAGANFAGSGAGVHLYELEMFAADGATGTDLTTGKTATASSIESGTYPASNVNNDDTGDTGWSSTGAESTTAWVQIDMVTAVTVRSLRLMPVASRITNLAYLQAADASSGPFQTVAPFAPVAGSGVWQAFTGLQP